MVDEKNTPGEHSPFDAEEDVSPSEAAALALGEEWPETMERGRGILTDRDRRFLWGIKEYDSRQQTSETRGVIRDRIVNAVRDLSYLSMLNEDYRERVFARLEEETDRGELRDSVASLVEFLYLGLDGDIEWFEETVAHGVHNAERELQDDEKTFYAGASVDAGVDVDIEVTRGYDVDEIEARLRSGRGNTLTPAEIGVLVREGRIDEEDIWRLSYGEGGAPSPESGSPHDEGMPIDPTMPDRKWFAENENVDDLDLSDLWSDENDDS